MESFTVHVGVGVPLRASNVDTDQILPSRYLKRISRSGFEDALFAAWRREPDFVLNDPAFSGGTVLVAGPDFGTGSSREPAVWALQDYGFRVVISPRFGDIFRNNAGKSGLLVLTLPEPTVERLLDALEAEPGREITVDLRRGAVRCGDLETAFEIDEYTRWRLLNGFDDIAITLESSAAIAEYEARRWRLMPRIQEAAR
ncbi:3-isopropylmalate dehydratase small subunit [Pseudolysinimonas sp.]|uniref:3-isopropylmalate dehydratase small subunit n=1 Tax=Pseudolysinimonas sp. TaxID=2680009 RepID=UPI003F816A07